MRGFRSTTRVCKDKHHDVHWSLPLPRARSRSDHDKDQANGRNYSKEISQFNQEMLNATGYGCVDASEKERIKNNRSHDDQHWEEASRQREIDAAKADFQCKIAAGELKIDQEWAPYYWCQSLSWHTCLCDKSPPRDRTASSSATRTSRSSATRTSSRSSATRTSGSQTLNRT